MALEYRREIDGLRAVAVVSVVAYHAGVPGFGGGFVGVDVFFVISGFLISTLLVVELQTRGSIDLLAFYARRARRLLPAFFLVVAVTLLLGWLFLVPLESEQDSLASSVVAAAVYLANVHFAQTTAGYFDAPSELQPMLHTWSLAVEEQFYFLWPILLLACGWIAARWRTGLAPLIWGLLAVIFAASLLFSWLSAAGSERAAHVAFFILPSRAWELAVGALLALALMRSAQNLPRSVGATLTAVGLLAIAISVIVFAHGMPFPSATALLPTLGAAAVIAGTWVTPQSAAARLLASPPMVAVGLLSYSWYLWHWPLLAIVRAHELGVKEVWRDSLVAVFALGLAAATYLLVESPVRRRQVAGAWSNIRILGAAAIGALLIIAGARTLQAHAVIAANEGALARLARVSADKGWSRLRCFHDAGKSFEALRPRRACMQPADAKKYIVVWGDSHADHLASMLETATAAHAVGLLPRTMSGCPPLLKVDIIRTGKAREGCAQFNRAVLDEIDEALRRDEVLGIVLSGRWSHYLGTPELTGDHTEDIVAQPGHKASASAAPEALVEGLRATLGALAQRGIKVVVVAPLPEQRFNVPMCLARRPVEFCSVPRDRAEQHRARALALVHAAIGNARDVRLWDPERWLCPDRRCWAERDGIIIYRDNDHLSPSGARSLAPHFADAASWLIEAQRGAKIRQSRRVDHSAAGR